MPKQPETQKLRGARLPKDIWNFLDSNIPVLIVKLLHQYIDQIEQENKRLLDLAGSQAARMTNLECKVDELEDEITRLKGERVMTKPVNSVATSKLKKERPVRKPRLKWYDKNH